MKASARLSLLAVVLASVAAVAQPNETLQVSEPQAIAAAAQSCRAATAPERLDEERLVADGWVRGNFSANGANVDPPLRVFARNSIVLFALPTSSGCVLTARIRDLASYPRVEAEMIAALGQPVRRAANTPTLWLVDDRVVRLEPSGHRDRPALRIAVIYSRSRQ